VIEHLFLDGEFIVNVPQSPRLGKEENPKTTVLETRESG
jgi:hypothetical protein